MASVRQLKITPFWHSIVFLIYLTMLIVQEVGFFMERSAYADRFGRTRMNANNLFAAPFVWKFYTRWVHFLTFLLYGFMVCGDLKTSCQRKPTSDNLSEESKQPTRDSLTATCDTVFVAFAFPQAMLICVAYWYMFWTMSKDDENELSHTFWIVNHGAHILPLPVVFVELLLVYHQRPSLVKGLLVALAPGLIYVVFISIYGQLTGVWPYPPLQGSWYRKIMFYTGAGLSTIVFYSIELGIHYAYWEDWKQLEISIQNVTPCHTIEKKKVGETIA